jgi:hypothetical protein
VTRWGTSRSACRARRQVLGTAAGRKSRAQVGVVLLSAFLWGAVWVASRRAAWDCTAWDHRSDMRRAAGVATGRCSVAAVRLTAVVFLALALVGLGGGVRLSGGLCYTTLVAGDLPWVLACRKRRSRAIRQSRNASGVRHVLGIAKMRSTGRAFDA